MSKLPKWIAVEECQRIFAIIHEAGGDSRLVGGCVRDVVLGKEHSDIDIATSLLPNQVLEILKKKDIKVIPTGLKHGTVTAVIKDKHYEITTLRKDVETDGRHAVVEFTNSWKEDAARRDFTVNAMSMDLDGKIYDYFDGLKDLEKKLVKFVGDPEKRIEEDYLRILRYFRFISYFGDAEIHKASLRACGNLAKGLGKISGERLHLEMFKILSSTFSLNAIRLMAKLKILDLINMPNIPDNIPNYNLSTNPIINLAILLRLSGYKKGEVSKLALRWRFSKKEKFLLEALVSLADFSLKSPVNVQKRFIYKLGKDLYLDSINMLNIESPLEVYIEFAELAKSWQMPEFKINGENVMKMGYNGPQVGKILNKLHQMWIESDFELSMEELLSRVEKNGN